MTQNYVHTPTTEPVPIDTRYQDGLEEPQDALQPESKEQLGFEDLTLFTGTFYGNDPSSRLRQELALELFEHANANGIRIVVSDGGSNEEFLEAAAILPNVTLVHEPGGSTMGSSRRFALEQAMAQAEDDPDHVFMWLEPEKVDLVDPETLTKLAQPIRDGLADIVVPSRTDFSTLPKQQAWIEQRANRRANNMMRGEDPSEAPNNQEPTLDLWFGPKVFNRKAAPYFTEYEGKLDKWDAIIKPVLTAYKEGLRVSAVPVEFNYPSAQSELEDGNTDFQRKRLQQYGSILVELGDTFWETHELVDGELRATTPDSK